MGDTGSHTGLDLISAMEQYGLSVDSLVMDEQIQRCGTIKKPKGKKNGWYCIYEDGKAAIYGNWEHGGGYEYWSNGTLTEIDTKKIDLRIEETRKKREKDWKKKSKEAVEFIESCDEEGFSEYLKNKQIYPHGVWFRRGNIVIPLQDSGGTVWSYQQISANGDKCFMTGGRVRGCYYMIADRNVSKNERVVVCEGFATGATIFQETGLPVIVALNAGNLKPVADSLVFRNIIIAADNDKSGVGERYARESGYEWVMPSKEGCDFNDIRGDVKPYFDLSNGSKQLDKAKPTESIGLVSEIADWITSTAIRPQPELSLAAAISFMSMLKGHRVRGRTNLRTNTLILSLAPTAAGKEHPQFAISRLAEACGVRKHVMGRPTSGTALLTGLIKSNGIGLLTVDEMGRYIGNITSKNAGSFQREISDYMVELFSCANRTFMGRQYANEKQNPQITIEQPHFCCLGSTVPERMQDACSSSEVVDGFLNRWLLFSSDDRPKKSRISGGYEPPEELVERIRVWVDEHPIQMDAYGNFEPQEVGFTPEAWDIFKDYDDAMEVSIGTAPYPMDKLYSRSAEHVEKLALILSDEDFIGTPEVKVAIAIVAKSNECISELSGNIADNDDERDFIRVKDKIQEMGEIKRSQLTYRCQFVRGGARRISEIINVLLDENVIAERKSGNKTLYKWILK